MHIVIDLLNSPVPFKDLWVTIIIIFRLLQDQRKWNCVNHVLYWLLVKMKSVSGLGGQDTKSQTDRLTVKVGDV